MTIDWRFQWRTGHPWCPWFWLALRQSTTSETAEDTAVDFMEPRIIKTNEQHRRCLEEGEKLAAQDPDPRSADGARLELLAKLVEDYEKSVYRFAKPDPVD